MKVLIDEMLAGRILLAEAKREFEKIYIEKALAQNDRHLIKTAAALGIHRNTLSAKLSAYQCREEHLAGTSSPRNTARKIHFKKPKVRAASGMR
jgi:DNA-binding NtrC family response regulator